MTPMPWRRFFGISPPEPAPSYGARQADEATESLDRMVVDLRTAVETITRVADDLRSTVSHTEGDHHEGQDHGHNRA